MKNLSMVSWNIRGVCNSVSKRIVKDALLECKANILCLQETKCSSWNTSSIRGLCGSQDFEWVEVSSRGLSGGLLCKYLWNATMYKLVYEVKKDNWVWCKLQSLVDDEI